MYTECTKCGDTRGALLLDREKERGTCFWCHSGRYTPDEEDQMLNNKKSQSESSPKKKKKVKFKAKKKGSNHGTSTGSTETD